MNRIACVVIALGVVLGVAFGAVAFIESPRHPAEAFTLSWVRQHAWIAVFKLDRVDADRGVVLYELTEQLQGKACPKRVRHVVQLNGKGLPDVDKLRAGQMVVCFGSQDKLVISYLQGSWYLSMSDKGDASVWRTIQQRRDLNCLFVGPAADLADAFRELAAGREVMVRCQKGLKEAATQFVRCRPAKTDKEKRELKRGEPVAALQAVADNLPADPAADPKKAVPALVHALRSDDPLVRTTAAKLLKQIDPEAAKKAGER
jgi:hypothetical protein